MSRFRELVEAGSFVVTGEIAPPLGTDLTAMRAAVDLLAPVCDAINVTDNQGASLHLSSLAASRVVLEMGVEPIFQQTCRDRNRLALQSDLLAAWTLGLTNLLAVTGDDPRSGDHPEAKGVFDLDSTQLVQVARGFNEGHDMKGRELRGATDFFIGAAMFPEAEPWDMQQARIEEKIAAGVRFFQTQAVFDLDKFARAADVVHAAGAKVIGGVLVLRSARAVRFINERLAGLMVPETIAARIEGADDAAEEGVLLATEQARALRELADGIHIMPLGLDSAVPRIVREAGIKS
ncbi:MAG TPA: methylenetetrahydrofolate reductase [Coriobacteriia bacterium]